MTFASGGVALALFAAKKPKNDAWVWILSAVLALSALLAVFCLFQIENNRGRIDQDLNSPNADVAAFFHSVVSQDLATSLLLLGALLGFKEK